MEEKQMIVFDDNMDNEKKLEENINNFFKKNKIKKNYQNEILNKLEKNELEFEELRDYEDDELEGLLIDDCAIDLPKVQLKRFMKALKKYKTVNWNENDKRLILVTKITNENEILKISSNNLLKNDICQREQKMLTINVSKIMKDLSNVGKTIQLAYVSSEGFDCQKHVMKLMGKYQSLIKDSFITCNVFVASTITSLRNHKLSYQLLKSENTEKAMMFLSKNAKLAEEMANAANNLVKLSQELVDIGQEALEQGTDDKTKTSLEQKGMNERIKKLKMEQAEHEMKTKLLQEEISQLKEEEKQVIERSKSFSNNIIKVFQTIVSATASEMGRNIEIIGNIFGIPSINKNKNENDSENDSENENENENKTNDNKKSKRKKKRKKKHKHKNKKNENEKQKNDLNHLMELEKKIKNKRYKLQEYKLESNAILARTITELKQSTLEKNELQQAVTSLCIAVNSLGKIKTVFENVRVYWTSVRNYCKQLENKAKDFLQLDAIQIDQLQNLIQISAMEWFVLLKINFDAKESIRQVDNTIDNIMNTLPKNTSQALKLVKELSSDIENSIEQEKQLHLENEKKIKAIQN